MALEDAASRVHGGKLVVLTKRVLGLKVETARVVLLDGNE
jgi:hypothetical protein